MGDDRLYPARPLLGASCAVFRGGRVLIAARARAPLAELWSLPGGLVEVGEELEAAALRELKEEVGVEAVIAGFAGHAEFIERERGRVRRHFVVAAFAARWRAGEALVGPEAGAVRWMAPEEVAGLATTAGLADILARAAEIVGRE